MALFGFGSSPEDIEEKERKNAEAERKKAEAEQEQQRIKAEQAQRQIEANFNASPAGKARAVKALGAKIFQIEIPLSSTALTPATNYSMGDGKNSKLHHNTLQAIEDEGWCLEHTGYVYRPVSSESRTNQMATGEHQAHSGEIVGIYVFRPAVSA